MSKALGIVNFSGSHVYVEGLQDYRPIGAFSFLGRYRVIDFPISNMSNSGIEYIQIYANKQPRSLVEHIGTGRHYNINSKRGDLHMLFSETNIANPIYDTDIAAYINNMQYIERAHQEYVIIAPSYMVYTEDYDELLETHIKSEADITMLYHAVDNAKDKFLNCYTLNLNKQKGVLSLEKNRGTAKNKNIFMDTYVMKKDLFIQLIEDAHKVSSMYTLPQIINMKCTAPDDSEKLNILGVAHRGYFASITDFKSYYDANLSLIDAKTRNTLFDEEWPIYTRTNDSCPTHYFEGASVKTSIVSNGCTIEGEIENSIIGRACVIKKGAVIKNSIILPGAVIGENVHIENQVVDKYAKVTHVKEIIGDPENPGYIKREDRI